MYDLHLDSSVSSLTLDELCTPSIAGSLASRHSYNTRLSAKLKAARSRLSLDIKEPLLPETPIIKTQKQILHSASQIDSVSSVWKTFFMPRGRNQPLVACDQCPSCMEKICWYLACFIAIVSLGALSTYLMQTFQDSGGSFQFFNHELSVLKKEMQNMRNEVQGVFHARDDTEKKLEVIESLLMDLKRNAQKTSASDRKCPARRDSKTTVIRDEINEALNLYADDKTGKTDFALESAGGSILGVRDTESYPTSDTVRFWGIVICKKANSARAILQPGTLPGECWAFKGSKGCAVIRLLGKVRITGITLEHISPSMSPSGEITTAPKDFTIKGLKSADDENPDFLGKFAYKMNSTRLQYFEVRNCDKAYDIIEFKVLSNHGHPEFTCVYRIRVHGDLQG